MTGEKRGRPPAECPDEEYREFIASVHTAAVHMHLGQAGKSASFPFNLHTAAEARGATFKVGSNVLHDRGRLAVADDPRVKAVAARYAGRPGIQPEFRSRKFKATD